MIATVRSNVTPDITINFDGSRGESPLASFLLGLVQPSVTVWGYSYIPYGRPGVMGGVVFLCAVLIFAYGLYKLMGF